MTPAYCARSLSPITFDIYVDELLLRLSHSRHGCKIGHLYYRAVGYVDDVALVALFVYHMKSCFKLH